MEKSLSGFFYFYLFDYILKDTLRAKKNGVSPWTPYVGPKSLFYTRGQASLTFSVGGPCGLYLYHSSNFTGIKIDHQNLPIKSLTKKFFLPSSFQNEWLKNSKHPARVLSGEKFLFNFKYVEVYKDQCQYQGINMCVYMGYLLNDTKHEVKMAR